MRRLTLGLLVCALLGAPAVTSAGDPPGPPNIVVFYMDDVSPHDGRLWEDPSLTPTLHNLFVAHGVEFTNAIGETPFCCPGRADLLTGLHTHNNDVVDNDGRLFHPQEHIGKALKDAGYASMFVGKYLNMNNLFTSSQWTKNGAGWSYLDAIHGANGDFYGYNVHTKSGSVRYGQVHSTQMTVDRTIDHIRNTPAGTPVFSVLSVYNLHGPNTPLPQFKDDPRCDSMPPWKSGSYNEADMSDKHPAIAARPKLPNPDGWPMKRYCREMLGVDWMVDEVKDALQAEGRLSNTLLVFTADNGMTWGQHRLGQTKQTPYAVPVPLYMSWPARWGNNHRVISDFVSNIDLAPTFCDLADGCDLGPYPTGQDGPDGLSMLPMLDDLTGTVNMGRDAVLEAGWNTPEPGGGFEGFPWWHGLRTTPSNPLGRWHYVEYVDGFRELYNSTNDPHELQNVANNPGNAALVAALSARLDELFHEGRTPASFNWPDPAISVNGSSFKGRDIYARHAVAAQTQTVNVDQGTSTDFVVRVTNHHDETADFKVKASVSGSSSMSVRYRYKNADVTSQMPGFVLQDVPAEGSVDFIIRILSDSSGTGATKRVDLTVMLLADSLQLDVVRASAIRDAPPAVKAQVPRRAESESPTPTQSVIWLSSSP